MESWLDNIGWKCEDEHMGALERGLRTLRMDGVNKLLTGQTTPEEVLRVTQLDIT